MTKPATLDQRAVLMAIGRWDRSIRQISRSTCFPEGKVFWITRLLETCQVIVGPERHGPTRLISLTGKGTKLYRELREIERGSTRYGS
ncbi:MAG: hypothetical protein WB643_01895 [Candidatus Bathyarchaeia archaeon]